MIDIKDSYNVASKQKELLNMLKDFHCFCVNNGIKYSIIGGTLLGAIREKGFIPWDDDVDILMDRDNFEKLSNLIKSNEEYCLQEILWVYKIVNKKYISELDNNTSVIDIFIVDNVPLGRLKYKFKLLSLKFIQGMMKKEKNPNKEFSLFYRIALAVTGLIGKMFSLKRKQKLYRSVSVWGNKEHAEYLMISNDIFKSLACKYDAGLVDEYYLVDFEDTQFMATKKWDNYLTIQYGDYMVPVKENH